MRCLHKCEACRASQDGDCFHAVNSEITGCPLLLSCGASISDLNSLCTVILAGKICHEKSPEFAGQRLEDFDDQIINDYIGGSFQRMQEFGPRVYRPFMQVNESLLIPICLFKMLVQLRKQQSCCMLY